MVRKLLYLSLVAALVFGCGLSTSVHLALEHGPHVGHSPHAPAVAHPHEHGHGDDHGHRHSHGEPAEEGERLAEAQHRHDVPDSHYPADHEHRISEQNLLLLRVKTTAQVGVAVAVVADGMALERATDPILPPFIAAFSPPERSTPSLRGPPVA